MFIAHVIENDLHMRTRMFNTDRPPKDIAIELMLFQGGSDKSVNRELILCDENNYPLEDIA